MGSLLVRNELKDSYGYKRNIKGNYPKSNRNLKESIADSDPFRPGAGFKLKKRRLLCISDNFMITMVVFPYGNDSQKVQNMFLCG
jgi:hypothetical protein